MVFLFSLLILAQNITKYANIFNILSYFKKGKNATNTQNTNSIGIIYRESIVNDSTEDLLLNNAPCSGRPAEVDSSQFKILPEKNQSYTICETANIHKIFKSITGNHFYQFGLSL